MTSSAVAVRRIALLLPALLLGACSQAPTPTSPAAQTPAAPSPTIQRPGVYAVSFQGVGTPGFSATALPVSGLAAQGLVGVPEAQFTLTPLATSTFLDRTTKVRHVQATFRVTNITGQAVPGLTFVPVVTASSNGTTFRGVTYFDGSDAASKAAILQTAAAQTFDLATGQAKVDPAAPPYVTGLDVSPLNPSGATSVKNYGWQLGSPLAPSASASVTFAVDFPSDAAGAAKDPFNFSLLLTTASEVPAPAFTGTLKSAVQQLDPVSKTFGNYTRLVTQTYTENGATVTHSLPAYYDLSSNTPAVVCSFDANLLLNNISTASFPNRYRVEVTSRAAHQLQVYAGTACPATEGTSLLTQTVTGVAPQGQIVAGGRDHSLALKADGTVQSWGDNSNGQLGNGTTTSSNIPVSVTGLSNAVGLAGGVGHSLALKANGTVQSWGRNDIGQLGDGTTANSSNIPVNVSNLSGVVGIASGSNHSLALKADGTVQSWGYNQTGELGNGTTTNSNIPVSVSGLTDVVGIAGGALHSLALKADGTVQSWGYNNSGQLGNGTTTNSNVPVSVTGLSVPGLSSVVSIAGGNSHSLALKADGTVQSWGNNSSGQLGNGTNTSSNVPVSVTGLGNVVGLMSGGNDLISRGNSHSLALKADGTVQSWGFNVQGQLGNGTNTRRNTPGPVSIIGVAQPTP